VVGRMPKKAFLTTPAVNFMTGGTAIVMLTSKPRRIKVNRSLANIGVRRFKTRQRLLRGLHMGFRQLKRKRMAYTAKDIKILSPEEILEFDFALTEHFIKEYFKPKDFIQRGMEATRLCGLCPRQFFEARYLKGDKTIPVPAEFIIISRELQKAAHQNK